MNLKLYRIKTVIDYFFNSWKNSSIIKEYAPNKNRLKIYFSLLFWFYFYGNDFNDYCSFEFWKKNKTEKKTYISLRRNDKLRLRLSTPEIHKLFLDKALFNESFKNYIKREWIDCRISNIEKITTFIQKHKVVIIKPLYDFGGKGIKKIFYKDIGKDEIHSLSKSEYIIEECIENNANINKLAPGSLNTIRIVTVIDKNNKLHQIAALLRMGNGTGITDNYHDGGMACPINLTTFRLSETAYSMKCKQYTFHPISELPFKDFYDPAFLECYKLVEELAFIYPTARYVGWDFAITPTGIELIEANIPPGEDITQLATGRGLWYDINAMI